MGKKKHCDGFLGCRTPKHVETTLKNICSQHNRDISEVLNYLCRLFIEDKDSIRTTFLGGLDIVEDKMA